MSDLETAQKLYLEGFAASDPEILRQYVADSFIQHEGGTRREDVEGLVGWTKVLRAAFPDIRYSIAASTIDANGHVWLHAQFTGTHRGEFAGIAPTGKTVTGNFLDRLRFEKGKLAEHWGASDHAGLRAQLIGRSSD